MEINGQQVEQTVNYAALGLSPEIMRALDKKGYATATPVQGGAIPYFMDWRDVIAKAPTGSGKTFAFGIPMIEHADADDPTVQALVLAPTRELALQIEAELRALCEFKPGVRVTCLYGGSSMDKQVNALKKKPQIVVATPGRLMDHMKRKNLRLDKVQTVVLDEADRMLDMGFIEDVTKILDKMPHRRNLGMFSATLSVEVLDISWVYQRDPVEITVQAVAEDKPDIQQYRVELDWRDKTELTAKLIEAGNYERAIAFCNTKAMTDRLAGLLRARGLDADCIHGDVRQSMREATLKKFRNGRLRVLVATDVAARGLDIDDVDAVFNYDVPEENEYYIHRIGRTGRAKRHGVSYTLTTSIAERVRMNEIERATRNEVSRLKYENGVLLEL
ncbi:MAG: DEAD/DEAH box helicase [Eubacteriales bacterium]|nr:DEAD/DEAH box helicase [Eubacteriales bacterium]